MEEKKDTQLRTYFAPTFQKIGLDGTCQCFYPSKEPPYSNLEKLLSGTSDEEEIEQTVSIWGDSQVHTSGNTIFGNDGIKF